MPLDGIAEMFAAPDKVAGRSLQWKPYAELVNGHVEPGATFSQLSHWVELHPLFFFCATKGGSASQSVQSIQVSL